jgi:uncharacterized membrane protein YpjA
VLAGLWDWLDQFRARRSLAALLIAVNLGGVAYGFAYYGLQFEVTPPWLWPWVPDSPLSVGFFALALALHQLRRPSPLVDWLAVIANVKVGLWTGFVLLHYDAAFHIFVAPLGNLNFWLFWLHLAMALQALVLARSLRLGWWSGAAAGWFALDIAMDYGLAPVRFGGCTGTKPITVPCADLGLLVAVTIALWLLGVALAAAMAMRVGASAQGKPAPTQP